MSSTCLVSGAIGLYNGDTVCGADLPYGAVLCAVLNYCMVLRQVEFDVANNAKVGQVSPATPLRAAYELSPYALHTMPCHPLRVA
eukprot:3931906-Rhodomonas_salina.1